MLIQYLHENTNRLHYCLGRIALERSTPGPHEIKFPQLPFSEGTQDSEEELTVAGKRMRILTHIGENSEDEHVRAVLCELDDELVLGLLYEAVEELFCLLFDLAIPKNTD